MKRLFLVIFVTLCAYLLYTPIPEGLEEPFKYRFLIASIRFMGLTVKVQDFIWPDAANDMIAYRRTMNLVTIGLKDTKEGSKFKARVTYFDGVKVRIYEPIEKSPELLPGFIYLHGGGFCIGSTEYYDGATREMADELNAVVVSVDYRLSPEHPFPAPFEDSLKASEWFISHAKQFGVDASRIGVGGDSAGGYLTSLVVQFLLKKNIRTKVQMLIYPATAIMDTSTPGWQKYQRDFGDSGTLPLSLVSRFYVYHIFGSKNWEFEKAFMENNHLSSYIKDTDFVKKYYNHSLIPEEMRSPSFYRGPTDPTRGSERVWNSIKDVLLNDRFNAFINLPMEGLPPAYVATCGFDSIRDEGILYGRALNSSGVDVTWNHYENAFHGIFWLGSDFRFGLGDRIRKEAFEFVKSKL